MKNFQQTIKKNSKISGVGLHTGVISNITFKPAKINHGIVFQRIDLKNTESTRKVYAMAITLK